MIEKIKAAVLDTSYDASFIALAKENKYSFIIADEKLRPVK
jgi:predicted nucleic acid-binding protein